MSGTIYKIVAHPDNYWLYQLSMKILHLHCGTFSDVSVAFLFRPYFFEHRAKHQIMWQQCLLFSYQFHDNNEISLGNLRGKLQMRPYKVKNNVQELAVIMLHNKQVIMVALNWHLWRKHPWLQPGTYSLKVLCNCFCIYIYSLLFMIFHLCDVARWNWTYGHIQIVLTSTQKVDNVIPVRAQLLI